MSRIRDIARMAHEANKLYCEKIGDDSQPHWTDAPDGQKDSIAKGVCFLMNNPDAKPSDSHESWLSYKEANGWKYGPVKDTEKKEHPCFVPFDELPDEQQIKDILFVKLVRALLQVF